MAEYCPDCENEILPYLKTGEYKEVKAETIYADTGKKVATGVNYFLVTYQCYFCIHCKTVFWKEHDRFNFKPLIAKELKDAATDGDDQD